MVAGSIDRLLESPHFRSNGETNGKGYEIILSEIPKSLHEFAPGSHFPEEVLQATNPHYIQQYLNGLATNLAVIRNIGNPHYEGPLELSGPLPSEETFRACGLKFTLIRN